MASSDSLYYCLSIIFLIAGCRPFTVADAPPDLNWKNISSSLGPLPKGFEVFEGTDQKAPIHAWYTRFDPRSPSIHLSVEIADGETGRKSVRRFAEDMGACLAVNGGYFLNKNGRSYPIGLLVSGGEIRSEATHGIFYGDYRYESLRAALGFFENGSVDITWASSRDDSVFSWSRPVNNREDFPAVMPLADSSEHWPVVFAVAGGPSLFQNIADSITIEEEVFIDSPIPNTHPRTAAGITEDGLLILMVVDGRQRASRGVDLDELAQMMRGAGAVRALNLDGGGSSAIVVNSTLLNHPAGTVAERDVASAIVVRCSL